MNSSVPLDLEEISDKIQLKTEEVGLTISQVFQTMVGYFATLIGTAMTITGVSIISDWTDWRWILFTVVLGIFPLLFGVQFIRRTARQVKQRRTVFNEKKILKIILRRNGSLTAQQIAVQTSLGIAEVNKALDSLYGQGMLEIKVAEDKGIMYYELSEALRWNKKLLY